MVKQIKKHWDMAVVFSLGSVLMISALFAVFPHPVFSQVSTSIVVSATVQPYLTFTSSATTATLSPDLVDNSGNPHVASSSSITLTVNTSSPGGFTITESDASHGLASSSYAIVTTGATTTIVAGTNGYGIQATSTNVDSISSQFDWPFTGTIVGNASSTATQNIATQNSAAAGSTVNIRFVAAATTSAPAATYKDTVTLTAVPTP